MRKLYLILAVYLFAVQAGQSQTILSDVTLPSIRDMEAYERAHPDLFRPCPTCPKKEADEGWKEMTGPMQVPAGANIKMSQPLPQRNANTNNPVPAVPSRSPAQQWLGHVDPGNTIPPDTYGAVGLNHVMTATNDFVKIHNKAGGAQVSQVSISTFCTQAGTCDPQVFFDPSTQRWFFNSIQCNVSVGNVVILMVSSGADPTTSTWRKITWIAGATTLLDHPYLGLDDTKVVVGGRRFSTTAFLGPSVYLVDKAAFIAGTAITFGTNAQAIDMGPAEGDAPRPVTVYFPPFSNSGNPSPGTVYITQAWSNTSLRLTTVTGNIPACVWNTGSAVFPTAPGGEAWTAFNHGNSVQQDVTVETRRIASNDSRTSSAIMMNGKIWVAQHCAFPAGAVGNAVTHTDVQYWQLDGTPGASFGSVLQRGRTGAVAGQHRWFSSIAVNKNEDVLVGYSLSSTAPGSFPSAAYSTRQASTPANTLDDPLIYHAGEANYWKDFGSGRTRWGDYSQAHLDPVDNSLWTITEYASTRAGAGDNNSRYGVWWAQVAPTSAGPTPIIVANGSALTAENCVPNNSAVDPQEQVTMNFTLQNTGTGATSNLVATLQATGGVVPVTTSQNYGVIASAGGTATRAFTFNNSSAVCGGTITVTLSLQDGATNLGTVSYTITLGTTTTVTSQNFDAVVAPALPAGWVATNAAGAAPLWVTSTTTPFSAPNAAFVDDPAAVSDKILETASFTPAAGARVSFRNNFNLESGFDGGVLEISINGGAYQDIITAGGTFTAGGYVGTISTCCSNPLASRNAWTGNAGGYIVSTAALPASAAGQPCKLRFRMGSDNSVAATGWRIDDLTISQPSCCGNACSIVCPPNVTVNVTAGQCGAIVTLPTPTTTGLCGPVTLSPASGSFFPKGTTTVTASTAAGPSCTFTVTVVDNIAPTITCPANLTVNNTPGLCSAVVNYNLPTVTDNCGLPGPLTLAQTASQTPVAGSVSCNTGGIHTDNSYWRAYNLTALSLPGTVTINSVQFGVEQATAGSGGSQTVTVRLYTQTTGVFPGGTRTQIYTQNVTVPDQQLGVMNVPLTTPPTIPANSVLIMELFTPSGAAPLNNRFFIGSNTSAQSGPSYISAASCGIANPTDLASLGFPNMHIILNANCTVSGPSPVVQIAGLPSGSVFPVGTTVNTFRATDGAGNTSTCSFNVTVVDNQPPTITCPANITVNTPVGSCTAVVNYTVTATDNCPGVTTALTSGAGTASGSAFPIGATTVTWRATDAAGNISNCSFTVTVNDGQLPVITAQPSNKLGCVGGNATFNVTAVTSPNAGGPLAYQWQAWNGSAWVNISGANTSSLAFSNLTLAQNTNSYRVLVTGLCTTVTSNFATLYVNSLPTVSILTSRPPTLLPGQNITLTAVVNPSGGSYQWYKNNVAIAGATGASISGLTVDDIGNYKVVYTDLNGCTQTSSDVVLSGLASDKLYVYPNPNRGQFQVRFYNLANESVTVNIYDAKGAKIMVKAVVTAGITYSRIDMDMTGKPSGTYLCEVVNGAGKVIGARKFIKYN